MTTTQEHDDERYLDKVFPKGNKLRGEAMVLMALARRRGRLEAFEELAEKK